MYISTCKSLHDAACTILSCYHLQYALGYGYRRVGLLILIVIGVCVVVRILDRVRLGYEWGKIMVLFIVIPNWEQFQIVRAVEHNL